MKNMSNMKNSPNKLKNLELQKTINKRFRFSVGLIGFTSLAVLFHSYFTKNQPGFVRNLYFDKLFNSNTEEKNKTNINFYYKLKLLRFLLAANFVPKAEIKIQNPDLLNCEIFNTKFKYPVGLGPGIDNSGSLISNLHDLGFEFIEIGPISTEVDLDKTNPEFIIDNNSNSIFIKNIENPTKIENSIMSVQKELHKILNKKNANLLNQSQLCISSNLKLSEKSSRTVPYMSDTLFIKLIKTSLPLSDILVLNLSSYTSKTILQYKNKNKFELLLNKIKDEVFYEYGVKAVIEHELVNKTKESQASLTSLLNLNYPLQFFKRNRTKLLIRFDTKLSTEDLENYIEVIKKSQIIDGIVVGGMLSNKENTSFICGEKCKDVSLELLKKCFSLTKGEIPLISTGGVLNGEDVFTRLQNGADFVLIFSPFLFNGPYCLEKIIPELEEKMKKEGKKSIYEIRNNP